MDPEVRYALNGGVSLAYEVVGEGSLTLVCLCPFDNLEINWENPLYAHFLRRLGASAQLVLMDRRGSGLSDRFSPDDIPALEVLVDDISVVLDAVGCERAVLFGFEAAAAQCVMFAATRPDQYRVWCCTRRRLAAPAARLPMAVVRPGVGLVPR